MKIFSGCDDFLAFPPCSSVLLIPNFLVFCANFSSKLNSSPRLRASAVQLVFSGFSPYLRGGFLFLVVAAHHNCLPHSRVSRNCFFNILPPGFRGRVSVRSTRNCGTLKS